MSLEFAIPIKPPLDPGFVPAVLWNCAFAAACEDQGGRLVTLEVLRGEKVVANFSTKVLAGDSARGLNERYLERAAKFLLWSAGGDGLRVEGHAELDSFLKKTYSADGPRAFDASFFADIFSGSTSAVSGLGGHWQGCRVGFDLGASDRKCAAVRDGEVVHTEEVRWDPGAHTDPAWHIAEIQDSIHRAAAKLPRLDAIGGSCAGILVGGEIRMSSLMRGVTDAQQMRSLLKRVSAAWPDIPFAALNDGAVTALLGASASERKPMLGLALGSSLAAGSVGKDGWIRTGIDELAFAPIDYREDAPLDEWSGDRGCGVQYLSQQAVARLLPAAGITIPEVMPLPEKLACVQQLMGSGNPKAQQLYKTLGVYAAYAIAHYGSFYPIDNVLLLGRVLTGSGGQVLIDEARRVLKEVTPEYADVHIETLNEQGKRHGQAVAAASLPPMAKP
jgi:predicted NBD/HSP70 family sugar kinase